MIGDHQEIQRSNQLHRLTRVGNYFITPRHSITIVSGKRRSDEPRVKRQVGVEVHVAEKHAIWICSSGIG